MERNWDIIREIMLKVEEKGPKKGPLQLKDFPANKEHEYSYNVGLLIDAGLIKGKMKEASSSNASDFNAHELTWFGHELLDTIKNDNIWNKTKDAFAKSSIAMTIDLVKQVAVDISTAALKSMING